MKKWFLTTCKYFFFIFAVIQCSGCMYGGAAVTGAQVVYDRHNLQKKISNHYAAIKAYRAIYFENDDYKDTHVSVSAFNNIMLITGQTPTAQQKNAIGGIVKNIAQDREVYNLSEIASPVSALTRISDSWITTKIKSKMIAASEIDPNLIKVITENGTVFLIGIVPPEQAESVVRIAKETSGVQSVVKIFSYLHVSKT